MNFSDDQPATEFIVADALAALSRLDVIDGLFDRATVLGGRQRGI